MKRRQNSICSYLKDDSVSRYLANGSVSRGLPVKATCAAHRSEQAPGDQLKRRISRREPAEDLEEPANICKKHKHLEEWANRAKETVSARELTAERRGGRHL